MKAYEVYVPINGYVVMQIAAESQEAAIKEALEQEVNMADIMEFDMYGHIMDGNMCQAQYTDAFAEELTTESLKWNICDHVEGLHECYC